MLTRRIFESHVENQTNENSVVLDTDDSLMTRLIYSKAMNGCLLEMAVLTTNLRITQKVTVTDEIYIPIFFVELLIKSGHLMLSDLTKTCQSLMIFHSHLFCSLFTQFLLLGKALF